MHNITSLEGTTQLDNGTVEDVRLHEYLHNNYYKYFIGLSFILLFAIVFNLIYLIIDSLLDKEKHYKLAMKVAGKYVASKRQREQQKNAKRAIGDAEQGADKKNANNKDSFELDKDNLQEKNKQVEFSSWSYRNLQISFIHSLACSVWILFILAFRWNEMFTDLLYFASWDTYLIIAFSCGYFLYDFYDVYTNGYIKIEWVVCVHHVIVLVSFCYHMTNLFSVGYTVVALFMEFNSVFLHARKLLKFYGYTNEELITRVNKLLNMLTFVFFRFGVLIFIYVSMYIDRSRISIPYALFLFVCVFLMNIINVVLFKRLMITDYIRPRMKRKQQTNLCAKNEVDHKDAAKNNEGSELKLLGNESDSNRGKCDA